MSIQKKNKKNKNINTVIRSELQEYPNVSLKEAIKRKLDLVNAEYQDLI